MLHVLALGLAALLCSTPVMAQETLLRTRLNSDIRSTDPGTNRDANTDAVVQHVVEGLVAYREDTSIGPLLAERVDQSEDGRTYTFTLRQGVRFHNGAVLTSADVKFAWDRYMRRETNWRCLPEFDGRGAARVTAVETPDPLTVVFQLAEPSALFLANMARVDCGGTGIWHRDSLNADGSWRTPVGTGPYRLGEWRRGQFVELMRFPDYVARVGERDGYTGNKAAFVDRIRWLIIPDAAAAKAALLSNTIDVIPDINSEDLPEYRARSDIRTSSTQTMGVMALLFQTRDPLLRDVRLRRAIALSLDLPEMARALSDGHSEYNPSIIPSRSPANGEAQREGYRRDLNEARRLLREAGYRGQTIRMLTTQRYSSVFDAAVMAQAMAKEAGINIEFDVLDWATLLDRYTRGDYAMMAFTYSARLDPSLSFEMVSGPKDAQPRKTWDNPEGLERLRESMRISDPARRQALFDDLHRRFIADVPMITLYNDANIAAFRANVTGFQTWPTGQPRFWGVRVR
ncbi:ABC transporter substrate-binding protein [Sabulicella rubraurantiaca]|uniref:ABC transporter substrate-binding protein n=1 Tax=Sabulicella rubraurantiaca TaxID=2811429 RepID=UPI001A96B1D5|nr:ABC transporter substrate-binding protein [Sabulicella rubraurantiaca]